MLLVAVESNKQAAAAQTPLKRHYYIE